MEWIPVRNARLDEVPLERARPRWNRRQVIIGIVAICATALGGFVALSVGSASATNGRTQATGPVDAGTASCTTDDEGYCTITHRLGQVPASVVVTLQAPMTGPDQLPYQLATDNFTATTFRLRALTNSGSVHVGVVTVSYVAGGKGVSISAPPSAPESSSAAPPTTSVPTSRPTSINPPVPDSATFYQIMNKMNGLVLDVPGDDTTFTDFVIWQWANQRTQDQFWRFTPVAEGFYTITNRNSGKVLAISPDLEGNGAKLMQVDPNTGDPSQQWRLEDAGDGEFWIRNRNTGRVLDIPGDDTDHSNGVQVQQWDLQEQALDQRWTIITLPPETATRPTPTRTPSPTGNTLTWAPPRLSDPVTVNVGNSNRSLKLDTGTDYVVRMPSTPLTAGGLSISGGRNVVLIGGEIRRDQQTSCDSSQRALYLRGQTGTVHIEGLLIAGKHLCEGINLDLRAPNTVVQLQNIRIEAVHGSRAGNHADLVQTWAGPDRLRIDHLTGSTTYQGLFLNPTDFGAVPTLFDIRNVNVNDSGATSPYLFWQSGSFRIGIQNVWARPNPNKSWPSGVLRPIATWRTVRKGTPPAGDFVPAGSVGTTYSSPGYK